MNTRKTYTGIVVAGLGLAGLVGCKNNKNDSVTKDVNISRSYFASVHTHDHLSLTNGDFDGDGDLDLIVGSAIYGAVEGNNGYLYFFENDGKGNFKLRENNYSAPTTQSK